MKVLMETRIPSDRKQVSTSIYIVHVYMNFIYIIINVHYSGYSQDPVIEIVELIKPEQGGLGLMILEDE